MHKKNGQHLITWTPDQVIQTSLYSYLLIFWPNLWAYSTNATLLVPKDDRALPIWPHVLHINPRNLLFDSIFTIWECMKRNRILHRVYWPLYLNIKNLNASGSIPLYVSDSISQYEEVWFENIIMHRVYWPLYLNTQKKKTNLNASGSITSCLDCPRIIDIFHQDVEGIGLRSHTQANELM